MKRVKGEYSSSNLYLLCFGLSALKCSLLFCHVSTDFEVSSIFILLKFVYLI